MVQYFVTNCWQMCKMFVISFVKNNNLHHIYQDLLYLKYYISFDSTNYITINELYISFTLTRNPNPTSSRKFSKHSYHRNRYIRFSIKWSLRLWMFSTKKQQQKRIIQYMSCKNFDNRVIQRELNSELLKIDFYNADLSEFTEIFLSILDQLAPK